MKNQNLNKLPIKRIRLVADSVAKYDQGVPAVTSIEGVVSLFKPLFAGAATEEMWVAILDSAHRPICIYMAGQGSENQCAVYPREIMKAVLLAGGCAFILAHNHPSGELKASYQDQDLTKAMQAAANTLQLRLLDHIIITDGGHYSFKSDGRL